MKIHYVRLSKEANDERLVVVAIKKRKQKRATEDAVNQKIIQ